MYFIFSQITAQNLLLLFKSFIFSLLYELIINN